MADQTLTPSTTGSVLHSAAFYDLLVWLKTLGRERVFREKVVDLASLKPGETVLDIGCGTGTLAIAAKRRVGPTGTVYGIDASPGMIARAGKKAHKARVEVAFKNGVVEALPFPDAHFDAVLSTLMLHHLPRKARQQCAREMRRVLKPGGRVLVVDFGGAEQEKRSLLSHFHRHGHVKLNDIIAVLSGAGLNIVESGAVGFSDMQFVLAAPHAVPDHGHRDQWAENYEFTTTKGHDRLQLHTRVLLVAVVVLIAAHGWILYYASSHVALSAAAMLSVIILVAITHLGWFSRLFAWFRRGDR